MTCKEEEEGRGVGWGGLGGGGLTYNGSHFTSMETQARKTLVIMVDSYYVLCKILVTVSNGRLHPDTRQPPPSA